MLYARRTNSNLYCILDTQYMLDAQYMLDTQYIRDTQYFMRIRKRHLRATRVQALHTRVRHTRTVSYLRTEFGARSIVRRPRRNRIREAACGSR